MAKGKVVITEDNLDAMEEALGLIRSEGVDTQPVSKVADPITLEYDKVFGTLKKFFPSLEGGEDLGGAILKVIEAACGSGGHGDLVFGLAGLAYNDRENFPKRLLKPLGEYLTTWVKKQEEYTEQIGEVVSLLFKLPIEKGKDLLTWLENHNEGYSCLLKILSCDETIELSYETIAWFFVNKSINSGEKGAFKDLPASVVKAFVDRAPKNLLWFVRNWLQLKQDQDQGKDKEVGYIIQKFLNKGEGWLDVNFVKWAWDQCEGIETFVINNSRRFYDITSFLKKAIDVPSRELFELIIKKSDNKAGVIKRALTHAIKQNKWEFANIIVEIGNSTDFELSGHPGLLKIIFEKGNTNSITTIIKKSDNKEILLVHALAHALRNSKNDLVDAIVTNESFTSITSDYVLFALKHLGIADKVKIRFIDLIIENSDKKADVLQVALDHAIEKKNWEIAKSVITKASSISASTYRHSNLMEMAFANDNDGEYIKLIIEKIAKKEVVLVYALAYALRNSKNDLVNFIVNNESFKSISGACVKSALEHIDIVDEVKIQFIRHIIEKSANKADVLRKALAYGIEQNNWEFAKSVITRASSISISTSRYDRLLKMAFTNDGEFIKTIIEKIADKNEDKEIVVVYSLAYALQNSREDIVNAIVTNKSFKSITSGYVRLGLGEIDDDNVKIRFIDLIIKNSDKTEGVLREALVYGIEKKNWEFAKSVITKASSIPPLYYQYEELIRMALDNDGEFIKTIIEKIADKDKESVLATALACAIKKNNWEVAKVVIDKASSISLTDEQYRALMEMAVGADDTEFIKLIIEKSRNKELVAQAALVYAIEENNWEVVKVVIDKASSIPLTDEQYIALMAMAFGADDTEFINRTIGKAKKHLYESTITKVLAYAINNKKEDIVLSILADENFNKLGDKRFSAVMNAMKMVTATAKDTSGLIKRCIYPFLEQLFIQPYGDKSEEAIIENLLMSIPSESEGAAGKIVSSLLVSVMKNNEITAERCGIVLKQLLKRGFIQTAKDIIFIQPYDDEREEKIIEKLLEPFTHKDNPREREIVVSLFVSVMENEKMTAERCGIVFKTLFKKGLSQAARAIIEKIKDKDDFITSILSKVRDYDKNITLETLVAGGVKKDKLIELAEKVGVDSSSIKDDPAPQDTPAVSAAAATPDVSVDTPLTRGVEDTPTADATDSPAVSAAATPAEDSESPASVVGDDTTPAEDSESPASVVGDDTTPAEDSESPASVVGDDTTLTRGVDTTPLTAPQVTTAGGAAAPGNDTSVSRSALLRGVPAAGLGAGLTAMGVYTAVLPPVFCVLSPLATVAMGACIFFIVGSLVSALYLGANATELAEQRYNREEEGGMSLSS
jgi:hypothetical protein